MGSGSATGTDAGTLPASKSGEWTVASWLASLDLTSIVAEVLAPPAGTKGQLEYIRKNLTEEQLQAQLGAAKLEGLAGPIWAAVSTLRGQGAATGSELSQKFVSDGGTFEMAFASLQVFYGGLEGLIGAPSMKNGSLQEAMEAEHTHAADSRTPFSTSNGVVGTTSEAEWAFVLETSDEGRQYAERGGDFVARHPEWCRKQTPLEEYDTAFRLKCDLLEAKGQPPLVLEELIAGRLCALDAASPHAASPHAASPHAASPHAAPPHAASPHAAPPHAAPPHAAAAHGVRAGAPAVADTGPMYEKYNATLRFFSGRLTYARGEAVPFLQSKCEALGLGRWVAATDGARSWEWANRYTTTIHAINSLCLKLSRLTDAATVYRGFSGATLPSTFFTPGRDGVCGGVELGFSSTTLDRAQAVHYASGRASTVFAMRMGMVDRGASLRWLSQYPHEDEMLFPPLMGLEVLRTSVQGHTLVVHARLSLNTKSLTLEEVVSKRRRTLLDMANAIAAEVYDELESGAHAAAWAPDDGSVPASEARARAQLWEAILREGVAMASAPEELNDDGRFKDAFDEAFRIKRFATFDWSEHEAECEARHRVAGACVPRAFRLTHMPAIATVPAAIGKCTLLREVKLSQLPSLRSLSERLGDLVALERLLVHECASLVKLPERLAECTALRQLSCADLPCLSSLPRRLGECARLATLETVDCARLEGLSSTLGQCAALTALDLTGCVALKALPDLSSIPVDALALKPPPDARLVGRWEAAGRKAVGEPAVGELIDATAARLALPTYKLPWLHPKLAQCAALVELRLEACPNLEGLVGMRSGDEPVYVDGANADSADEWARRSDEDKAAIWAAKRRRLAEGTPVEGDAYTRDFDLGDCAALESLTLLDAPKLTALGLAPLARCAKLRTLRLVGCTCLTRLPPLLLPSCDELSALEVNGARSCRGERTGVGGLAELDEQIRLASKLGALALTDCQLTTLPASIGECHALTSLDLGGCERLDRLPDAILTELGALAQLSLRGCAALAKLPAHEDALVAGAGAPLESLSLCGLVALCSLPAWLGTRRTLATVELSGCVNLRGGLLLADLAEMPEEAAASVRDQVRAIEATRAKERQAEEAATKAATKAALEAARAERDAHERVSLSIRLVAGEAFGARLSDGGNQVMEVQPSGLADKGGLRAKDCILSVNGVSLLRDDGALESAEPHITRARDHADEEPTLLLLLARPPAEPADEYSDYSSEEETEPQQAGQAQGPSVVDAPSACLSDASAGTAEPPATIPEAVPQRGGLYTWGTGEDGRLGHGDDKPRDVPKVVDILRDSHVSQIVCGDKHALVLDATSGIVSTWGDNSAGQLGHGDTALYLPFPTKVLPLKAECIVQIACGAMHSVALSAVGDVYAWGENTFGQLGLGDWSNKSLPHRVMELQGLMVTKIACGANRTACVTDANKTYMWGASGRSSEAFGKLAEPDCCIPEEVKGLEGVAAKEMLLLELHTMVLA